MNNIAHFLKELSTFYKSGLISSIILEIIFRTQLLGLILIQADLRDIMIRPFVIITQYFLIVPQIGSSDSQISSWFVYGMLTYCLSVLITLAFSLILYQKLNSQKITNKLLNFVAGTLRFHGKCLMIPILLASSNLLFVRYTGDSLQS